MQKIIARSVTEDFLTSMAIMPLRVTVEETQLLETTGFEINSVCVLICEPLAGSGKKNLIPDNQSRPGGIFVPAWKAGKPAAIDLIVTLSLQSSSLSNAATKARCALDVADEQIYCFHDNNCSKMGIT